MDYYPNTGIGEINFYFFSGERIWRFARGGAERGKEKLKGGGAVFVVAL
jgi:hypothetical protein